MIFVLVSHIHNKGCDKSGDINFGVKYLRRGFKRQKMAYVSVAVLILLVTTIILTGIMFGVGSIALPAVSFVFLLVVWQAYVVWQGNK